MSEQKPLPPSNVDAYIEAAPQAARPMLVRLRSIIHEAAPEATEVISYGVPSFKLRGSLVSFGAARTHCGFYVMSSAVVEAFRDELAGYDTSKGTVRFKFGDPLPEELIRRLVEARIAENEAARKR